MGRHKFRLSDMIPNAWFFKLRNMRARGGGGAAASPRVSRPPPSTPRHHGAAAAWLPHRASHYYTPRAGDLVLGGSPSPLHHLKASDTHFPPLQLSPPRRSRRRHRRRSVRMAAPPSSLSSSSGVASSPASTACRCGRRRPELLLGVQAPDTPPFCRRDMFVGYSSVDDDDEGDMKTPTVPDAGRLDGKVITSATEIIIDLRTKRRTEKTLPPIVTKPPPAKRDPDDGCQPEDKHIDVLAHAARRASPALAAASDEQSTPLKPRRSVSSARRLKTRANTPRLASSKKCKPPAAARSPARAKQQQPPPPPLAESFAVVKSSRDPRRDFRESMEEMITQNGIRTAADLEDLLACYLALNAAEYHDLIVEVFEHIWVTLSDVVKI
ncbi:hypothetical protein U9M48_017313 [Paspalum notatum var. saurae]|uniref:Transcription repressor n=1 Tax=Paspalum notatum var. saurae TaxID=547442 RepID=A0AAQ3TAP2_PASNO